MKKLCYKSISHIKVNALACQIRGEEPVTKRIRSHFLGDVFLSRQGGCDTILIYQRIQFKFHSYYSKK